MITKERLFSITESLTRTPTSSWSKSDTYLQAKVICNICIQLIIAAPFKRNPDSQIFSLVLWGQQVYLELLYLTFRMLQNTSSEVTVTKLITDLKPKKFKRGKGNKVNRSIIKIRKESVKIRYSLSLPTFWLSVAFKYWSTAFLWFYIVSRIFLLLVLQSVPKEYVSSEKLHLMFILLPVLC